MPRRGLFPDMPIMWYVVRGLFIGLAFGLFLSVLLILWMLSMGDGAGGNTWREIVRPMLVPLAGWGIRGPLGGVFFWLISLAVNRRR